MSAKRSMLTVLLCIWCAGANSYAQSITGRWKTIDDKTGESKSIVEIYEEDGKLCGKIVELFVKEGDDPEPVCDICPGERNGQKILGMRILEGLERNGDVWDHGEILDPDNGKIYRCKAWIEDGKLRLRGYVSVFFRTQTWLRAESEDR